MSKHVIEEKVPLSETQLWELQKLGYEQRGPSAWAGTNNPLFAHSYAWIIYSFLLDWQDDPNTPDLDLKQPVYILDIGCGAPQFGTLLIQKLRTLIAETDALRGLKPCLVGIDNVDEYADYWDNHPRLKPLFEKGLLDYAVIDTHFVKNIELKRSGVVLDKNTLTNPVIATLNYFLDQIPMELYRVGQLQTLERGLMTTSSKDNVKLEDLAGNKEALQSLQFEFDFDPMESADLYTDGDELATQVLEEYGNRLPEGAKFFFGVGGMKLLRFLSGMGAPGFLGLTGDKGELSIRNILEHQRKRPVWHGEVFSFDPNLHAVRRYMELLGGYSMAPIEPAQTFVVLANVLGMEQAAAARLGTAINVTQMGKRIVAYATLSHAIVKPKEAHSLLVLLEVMELSEFDPYLIHGLTKQIWIDLNNADDRTKNRMLHALKMIWKHFFWTGEADNIKVLRLVHGFLLLLDTASAKSCLDELTALGVETAHTHFYYGVCYQQMKNLVKMKEELEKTLEMDPNYKEAKFILAQVFGPET